MSKKISVSVLSLLLSLSFVYAENDFEDSFSLDSYFTEASDAASPVVKDDSVKTGNSAGISFRYPVNVNGKLETEIGFAYINEDKTNDGNCYFDFDNTINFSIAPDNFISLRGSIKTELPYSQKEYGQSSLLYVNELYADYSFLNHFNITAGKKKTVLGSFRLFTDSDIYSDDDALFTDMMNDSVKQLSGTLNAFTDHFSFTGMCLYGGTKSKPEIDDVSFAFNFEAVAGITVINVFGRIFEDDELNPKKSAAGVEIKTSLFDTDFYGQVVARISNGNEFKKLFTSRFNDTEAVDKIVSTAGFYRLWTANVPAFGINAEFQNVHFREDEGTYRSGDNLNRFIVSAGLSKLGKNKNLKLGVNWNHDITNETGKVKCGFIVSRILPHCDWKNGVEWEYGSSYEYGKLTAGSYINLSLNY